MRRWVLVAGLTLLPCAVGCVELTIAQADSRPVVCCVSGERRELYVFLVGNEYIELNYQLAFLGAEVVPGRDEWAIKEAIREGRAIVLFGKLPGERGVLGTWPPAEEDEPPRLVVSLEPMRIVELSLDARVDIDRRMRHLDPDEFGCARMLQQSSGAFFEIPGVIERDWIEAETGTSLKDL